MSDKCALTICLFQLSEKDAAVFQRVIAFSAHKHCAHRLTERVEEAQLVIMNNDDQTREKVASIGGTHYQLLVNDASMYPPDPTPMMDVITRPLLITRVMRKLDAIAAKLSTKTEETAASGRDMAQKRKRPPVDQDAHPSLPSLSVIPTSENQEDSHRPDKTNVTVLKSNQDDSTRAEDQPKDVYTALVVDDSLAIRKQLELELRKAGVKVEFAENGESSLEKTAHKTYDLIFLDIVMPGIDGYEVCRRLRTQAAFKKTPIIMLSGKNSSLDEIQGVISGCSSYLTKPVESLDLQKVLQRVVKWIGHIGPRQHPQAPAQTKDKMALKREH